MTRLLSIRSSRDAGRRRLLAELLSARLSDWSLSVEPSLVQNLSHDDLDRLCRDVEARLLHVAVAQRVIGTERAQRLRALYSAVPQRQIVGLAIMFEAAIFVDAVGLTVVATDRSVGALTGAQVLNLTHLLPNHLRGCECGRLYVRRRRQKFCSERCQKRVYMRDFRNR